MEMLFAAYFLMRLPNIFASFLVDSKFLLYIATLYPIFGYFKERNYSVNTETLLRRNFKQILKHITFEKNYYDSNINK